MKRMLGVILVWALLLAPFVLAEPTAAETVTAGTAESYTTATTPASVSVTAGTTTEVNVTVTTNTNWWAGLYGKITETIVLGAGTATMFSWTVNTVTGFIYATTSATVNWEALSAVTSDANIAAAIAGWAPKTETFAATFPNAETDNDAAAGYCGQAIATVYYALTNEDGGTAFWPTCAYIDDANVLVFEGATDNELINRGLATADENSFKGTDADYQIIVPSTTTGVTYYIWKG